MRLLQTEMRRASFTPVLSVSKQQVKPSQRTLTDSDGKEKRDLANAIAKVTMDGYYDLTLDITNIGQGPATGVAAWVTQVSSKFEFKGDDLYPTVKEAQYAQTAPMQVARDETTNFVWSQICGTGAALFIVECKDVALGTHQLQILAVPDGRQSSRNLDVEARMIHARGDTFGERLIRFLERTRDISRHVDRILATFENSD